MSFPVGEVVEFRADGSETALHGRIVRDDPLVSSEGRTAADCVATYYAEEGEPGCFGRARGRAHPVRVPAGTRFQYWSSALSPLRARRTLPRDVTLPDLAPPPGCRSVCRIEGQSVPIVTDAVVLYHTVLGQGSATAAEVNSTYESVFRSERARRLSGCALVAHAKKALAEQLGSGRVIYAMVVAEQVRRNREE